MTTDAAVILCAGRSAATGKPCQKRPMKGATVCRNHGGASPQVRAAAARRIAEREAQRALETYGVPIVTNPEDALLDEVHRTAGHVAWLGAVVAELEQQQLQQSSFLSGISEPSVWLRIYQDERKHLVNVAAAALKAGVEERRVQVVESQAAQLVQVIRALLGDARLGITASLEVQQQVIREAIAGVAVSTDKPVGSV